MKRALVACVVLLFVLGGCAGGSQTRTVLADYSNDQFASAFLGFFPTDVAVHPGDTITFRQTWTGEPHTVTMGHLVDPAEKLITPFLEKYRTGGFAALPHEEPKGIEEAFGKLPTIFDEKTNQIAQNGAQPCYLNTGSAPKEINTPCKHRAQPPFTGRQSLYNSGYIHYAGANGNVFRVPIAKDATPGHYYYFCLVHGPLMSGYIDIKPKGQSIPSQETVSRQASKELGVWSKPLETAWNTANAGKVVPPPEAKELVAPGSKYFKGIFVGLGALPDEKLQFESSINEFIPRKTTAKVGAPVTWTTFGGHTISFDVPKYFPIITVRKDGTVVRNPKLDAPAGGAPPLPKVDESNPKPAHIDGGTYDGSHFWSSGMINTPDDRYAQYTLRFSKPGTYRYACLVHPAMVGDITITP
jgi:plastocyanin